MLSGHILRKDLYRANALASAHRWDDAETAFRQLIGADDCVVANEARLDLVDMFIELAREEEAEPLLRAVVATADQDVLNSLKDDIRYLVQRRWDWTSIEAFIDEELSPCGIERGPLEQTAHAHLELGKGRCRRGDLDAAIGHWQLGLEACFRAQWFRPMIEVGEPRDHPHIFDVGPFTQTTPAIYQGRAVLLLELYQGGVDLTWALKDWWLRFGEEIRELMRFLEPFLDNAERHEEIERVLLELIRFGGPEILPRATLHLASLLHATGRHREAEHSYALATRLAPSSRVAFAVSKQASLFEIMERYAEARAAYEQVIGFGESDAASYARERLAIIREERFFF